MLNTLFKVIAAFFVIILASNSNSQEATEDITSTDAQTLREIKTLEVQENMENWAELMFYATAITTLLTSIALITIIITLRHTGRAADYTRDMLAEAKKTTKAALETVTVTKEIGDRQVRPYLTYSNGKITPLHVEGEGPESSFLHLDISFHNGGHSPCILTSVTSSIYSPRNTKGWTKERTSRRPLQIAIGVGENEKVGFETISADALGEFTVFSIGILVSYEDIYSCEYEYEIWLYFNGSELRQDIPFKAHGWEIKRSEIDNEYT